MRLLASEMWPLWVAVGLMAVAAAVNLRSPKVPNRLTLTTTLAGWLTALSINASSAPSTHGGILASLVASAVSLLAFLPLYTTLGLGAGCAKMQMAFGAWAGCAMGVGAASRLAAAAAVVGLIFMAIGARIAAVRVRPGSVGAAQPYHLFPAQVPLSLGSITGALLALLVGWA